MSLQPSAVQPGRLPIGLADGGGATEGFSSEDAALRLRRAALAVAQPGGPSLLSDLVHEVAQILRVPAVFVAAFRDDTRLQMRTLAVELDGKLLRNFDYALEGTPCAYVVGNAFRYVERGVAAEFPPGSLFGAKGMDSYAAYPLADSAGAPIGLLVAMDRAPIVDATLAEAVLKIFAGRIAAEIERGTADEALREAALAVSSARGASVFDELVRYLATILRVEVALVARHQPGDPDTMHVLAMWYDGELLRDVRYPVRGTPCATVIGQRFRVYPDRVLELFPEPSEARIEGAVGYAGHPLTDSAGQPIGIVAIVSRKPMTRVERIESMLQIFAVRAAAELERLRADEALRRSEMSYRAIFEAAEDAIFVHDWDTGRVVDVNAKACQTYGYSADELRSISIDRISSGVPPYTADEAARRVQQARENGWCPPFEWHRRNKDGSLHWDEVRLKVVEIGGQRRILAFTRDITERKRAEEDLRAREEQYRVIFEATSDAFVLRDSQLRIVDVNPAFERLYGFSSEVLTGDTGYPDSFPADYVESRREQHRRALRGEATHVETEAIRADGSTFEADLRVLPVRYRGEPHSLAVVRDITERKQAERTLALREEQYRAIFEGSADAMVLWSRDIRIVDVNRAFTRLYGYSHDEIIGAGFGDRIPVDGVQRRIEMIRAALDGREGQLETDAVKKNGERFDAELRYLPIVYRGEPHVLAVARDIGERKRALQALRDSEQQYRALFDESADAMVVRDAAFRIVDVNPACLALVGLTRESVLGKTLVLTQDPDQEAARREAHARVLAGEVVRLETTSKRRDGSRFDAEVRGMRVVYRGQPHALYVVRDITAARRAEAERAELEAQLRQAQKMEAIGQLTGGIAHDFNNILTSVVGYGAMARDRAEAIDDARLMRYLDQVQLGAQRARDLVAQMLTFSRRQRAQRSVLALVPLVRQTVRLLRATLPSTIELDSCEVDARADDTRLTVEADPVQIEQVLFNLCINARDAIGGAGRIRVCLGDARAGAWLCASCRERVEGGDGWIELSVADTGCGIEPGVLERMFDPFYTTKDVGRGSGMGLAMVHGIVHGHHGHIGVDSRPGAGSVFRVVLPLASQAVSAQADAVAARPPSPALLSGRVLLVEDEAMVGQFLGELLTDWGLDVLFEHDPRRALALVEQSANAIDLMITDRTMPHLTGLELAEQVRRLRPTLPVLLVTGDAAEIDGAELRRRGVDALLHKPIAPDELRATLQALLAVRATR